MLPYLPLGIMMVFFSAVYVLILKFSSRLLQINEITWKNGLIFVIILIITSILYRAAANSIGYSLPNVIGISLGLIVNLMIGGWFFSTRGKAADGKLLGWGGAVKLTGLSYVIFIVLGKILIFMSKVPFIERMP
jgi:hypothetical protein